MRTRRFSQLVMIGALLMAGSLGLWLDGLRKVGRAHLEFPSWISRERSFAAGIGLFHGNGGIGLFVEHWSRRLEHPDDGQYYRRGWSAEYSRWELEHLAPDQWPETFLSGPLQWRFRGFGLYDAVKQDVHHHVLEFPVWLPALIGGTLIACHFTRRRRTRRSESCGDPNPSRS
ncbi:MAG: hypothetical protein WD066_10175 [Planctomycetaceae bacterium]